MKFRRRSVLYNLVIIGFMAGLLTGCGMFGKSQEKLIKATQNGNLEKVKSLVSSGVSVNFKGGNKNLTPLQTAIKRDNPEIAKIFIKNGADVNATYEGIHHDGITPLHDAVQYGYNDVAKLLVQNGANMNAKNGEGFSPLFFALHENKMKLVKFFAKNGANLNKKGPNGNTPLEKVSDPEVKDFLKEHGAK